MRINFLKKVVLIVIIAVVSVFARDYMLAKRDNVSAYGEVNEHNVVANVSTNNLLKIIGTTRRHFEVCVVGIRSATERDDEFYVSNGLIETCEPIGFVRKNDVRKANVVEMRQLAQEMAAVARERQEETLRQERETQEAADALVNEKVTRALALFQQAKEGNYPWNLSPDDVNQMLDSLDQIKTCIVNGDYAICDGRNPHNRQGMRPESDRDGLRIFDYRVLFQRPNGRSGDFFTLRFNFFQEKLAVIQAEGNTRAWERSRWEGGETIIDRRFLNRLLDGFQPVPNNLGIEVKRLVDRDTIIKQVTLFNPIAIETMQRIAQGNEQQRQRERAERQRTCSHPSVVIGNLLMSSIDNSAYCSECGLRLSNDLPQVRAARAEFDRCIQMNGCWVVLMQSCNYERGRERHPSGICR